MKEYKVQASSMIATYTAGKFSASSPAQACEMAREHYAQSSLGRQMRDVSAFRFYVVDKYPYERDEGQEVES